MVRITIRVDNPNEVIEAYQMIDKNPSLNIIRIKNELALPV